MISKPGSQKVIKSIAGACPENKTGFLLGVAYYQTPNHGTQMTNTKQVQTPL